MEFLTFIKVFFENKIRRAHSEYFDRKLKFNKL